MKIFDNIEEWENYRLGKFTASEIWKLLGDGKTRETYILQKATEILTGEATTDLSGMKALEWGKKHEREAVPKGYIWHGEMPVFSPCKGFEDWAGASPDASLKSEIAEIKCPYNSVNHLANLQMKTGLDLLKLHKDYYTQIQFQLICTDASLAKFISYDPRFLEKKRQAKILTIEPDFDFQDQILEKLETAVTQLKQLIERAD